MVENWFQESSKQEKMEIKILTKRWNMLRNIVQSLILYYLVLGTEQRKQKGEIIKEITPANMLEMMADTNTYKKKN